MPLSECTLVRYVYMALFFFFSVPESVVRNCWCLMIYVYIFLMYDLGFHGVMTKIMYDRAAYVTQALGLVIVL
jgi:hypothetical protein